jgi:predicted phosphate transport protein (TIGR00153 family)
MDKTRNIFAWLGEREEKGVLKSALRHVEKSYECLMEMKNSIESLTVNDTEGKKQHIGRAKNAEHEGDEIKKAITNELSKGMFLPPDREDLLLLNEGLNDIADSAKGVVRLLEFFEKGPSAEINKLLLDDSLLAVKSGEKLKGAINALVKNDADIVMEECAQIEIIEEEGDDKRRDMINALIKTELSQQLTILVYEMIDNLENVIDSIKRTGDMVRILAIKAR